MIGRDGIQEGLTRFVAELASAQPSAAGLREAIVRAFSAALPSVTISWFEAPAARYVQTLTTGRAFGAGDIAFDPRGALARWLRVNGELLVFRDQPGVWAYLSREEQSALVALEAHACLPLVAEDTLVAFLVLSQGNELRGLRLRRPLLEACAAQGAARWREVTHREQEAARSAAVRRSEQLSVTGQVAASIAHEVRNPLAAIRSLVQLARDVPLPPAEQASMLDDVLEEVDRIDQTVGGMLELGHAPAASGPTDLGEAVRSATRFVRAYAARLGVELVAQIVAEEPIVAGNDRELRQVVTNLLLNACQASAPGGRVTVSVHIDDGPAGPARTARIEVRDDGHGIAAGDLARVFEPFFTTKPHGTGLGMPLSRDVVERHGGTITLESAVGVGTCVTIRLPLVELGKVAEADDIDSGRR